MALTRKKLKALEIEEETIEAIIAAHLETVDGLKAEIRELEQKCNTYENEKSKIESEKITAAEEKAAEWETKYNSLNDEYTQFKESKKAQDVLKAKEKAYFNLLKAISVDEKRWGAISKVTDYDKIELDESGNIKNADEVKNAAEIDWADFKVKTSTQGANTPTPPSNTGGGTTMTKAEIMGIKDASARQKAIAENPQLFGIETD